MQCPLPSNAGKSTASRDVVGVFSSGAVRTVVVSSDVTQGEIGGLKSENDGVEGQ